MANKSPNIDERAAEKRPGIAQKADGAVDDVYRPATDDSTFRSFIENLPVMFYAVAPTAPHKPIYISPTFEKFGYPLKVWLTDSDIWDRVIHPDDRENILGKTREAMRRGEGVDFEYRVVCKNGSVIRVRDRSCFIIDKNGEPLCWQGVILDITERNLADEKLRYYALHDTLTDLPNRVQFMNHLRQAVERADGNSYAKFAVLFLDLDRFVSPLEHSFEHLIYADAWDDRFRSIFNCRSEKISVRAVGKIFQPNAKNLQHSYSVRLSFDSCVNPLQKPASFAN